MIKMIPPRLDNTVKSNAERKVFNLIQNSALSGYCFHSVGLANHEYKSYAEADFIIVTENGILCLEVKGGQVSCIDGVWTFTDRFGKTNTKNEGPFEQANGAMRSIKTTLGRYGNLSFACGVIFPDIEFRSNNVSVIPEIQMNNNYSGNFDDYLKKCHSYWDSKFKITPMTLNQANIEAIRERIREDLNFVPLLSLYTETAERELVRLTREQADILEVAKNNPRLFVSGPAGSGKTLLAMEYAKMKSREGNRILFLTFNKCLAAFLRQTNNDENISIKSFHSLITEYTIPPKNGISLEIIEDSHIENSVSDYYDKALPDRLLKYLSTHKIAAYDILILDEGQDLLKDDYIACFHKLVKGTMLYGKWAIFYDSNQSIFNKNFDSNLNKIRKSSSPTELLLTKNCRNVIPIASFNNYLTNINTGRAIVEGEEIQLISYADIADGIEKINLTIQFLLKQGISKTEIVIVSPVSYEKSIINNKSINFPITLKWFGSDEIRYFTIQSFKGLESKIVIFVDYEGVIASNSAQLLYTSFSRAKALLYLFVNKDTAQKVQSKVIEHIASKN